MIRRAHVTKSYRPRHTQTGRETATISAEWHGGAYVDLSFDGGDVIEVINVWDYRTDTATIGHQRGAVRAALLEWIADNDAEELEQMLSASPASEDPEIRAMCRRRHPRYWLRNYIENS